MPLTGVRLSAKDAKEAMSELVNQVLFRQPSESYAVRVHGRPTEAQLLSIMDRLACVGYETVVDAKRVGDDTYVIATDAPCVIVDDNI